MFNRSTILMVLALFLGVAYAVYFTDWFKHKQIQISFRTFPGRAVQGEVEPIIILLDRQYKLTSVKVVAAAEAVTNKYARPLWQLISDTNSVPVTDFGYGEPVKGMKPSVPKAVAEKLVPQMKYRVIVEAGRLHGEREFTAKPAAVRAQ